MKAWTYLIMAVMMAGIVYSANCEERMDNGSSCLMITPILVGCQSYTYDIYRTNGTEVIKNAPLISLVNQSINGSIWYFNFTEEVGDYIITLCDATFQEFRVTETYDTKFYNEERARYMIAIVIAMTVILVAFLYFAHFFKESQPFMGLVPLRYLFIAVAYVIMLGIIKFSSDILTEYGYLTTARFLDGINFTMIIIFGIGVLLMAILYGAELAEKLINYIKYREW